MSDQGDSNLEVFQTLTRHNYQEAAKQRATRTLLPYPLHQGPRRGTSTRLRQSRSPEQSHQVDCLRESHLREYAEAGCQPEGLNRDTQTLPSMNPIPSQLVTPNFPACPTPCSMGSPHTLSFAFVTEAPIFRPISPSNGINTIDQSHQDFASPASNYQPETCGEGLLYPHYIHAGPSTFPPYNFPAEAYNGFNHQNAEFPLTNNCSFFSSEIPWPL